MDLLDKLRDITMWLDLSSDYSFHIVVSNMGKPESRNLQIFVLSRLKMVLWPAHCPSLETVLSEGQVHLTLTPAPTSTHGITSLITPFWPQWAKQWDLQPVRKQLGHQTEDVTVNMSSFELWLAVEGAGNGEIIQLTRRCCSCGEALVVFTRQPGAHSLPDPSILNGLLVNWTGAVQSWVSEPYTQSCSPEFKLHLTWISASLAFTQRWGLFTHKDFTQGVPPCLEASCFLSQRPTKRVYVWVPRWSLGWTWFVPYVKDN